MSKSDEKDNVYTAFEMLIEEIENVVISLKHEISEGVEKSKYDSVESIIKQVKSIEELENKVEDLEDKWNSIFKAFSGRKRKSKKSKKLRKGVKTSEESFKIPILQSLVELGGSGKVKDVLDLVEKKMEVKLNKYDYMLLSSDRSVRWKNTAQWARLELVKEGFLKSNSPRGMWEITDKGIEYLKSKGEK